MKITQPFLEKITNWSFWWGYATAATGAFVSYITPVWPYVVTAFVLVIADMVTGLRAAHKQGIIIKSRGLFRSIEKFVIYFLAIGVSEQMQRTFFPYLPVTQVVALGVCITEFYSMLENVEAITGVNILGRVKEILPNINLKKKVLPPINREKKEGQKQNDKTNNENTES